MIPEFPELRPLGPEHYPTLAQAVARALPATCDLIPANLFMWRDHEAPSITRVGDSLCILVEPRSEAAYFLEPVDGAHQVDAVRRCLTLVNCVSRAGKRLVEKLSPVEFELHPLRDYFDYVYRTQALIELKGRKFDAKRNHIRKFTQACPDHEFRPLHSSHFPHAMALFDRWAKRQDGAGAPRPYSTPSLDPECQRQALERAFEGFEQFGLVGGAMMVRGDLQGFVIGSRTPAGIAIVHFQYADTEIPGIYQALLREACVRLFKACVWVNLEEDLGVPGLRKTKLSYQPLRLEQKYEIRRREVKRAAASAA